MSYGKVRDVYWDDDKIETLSDQAALLGLFLISGPHRNAIGCFKLGMGAITDNDRFGKWGIEGVSKALLELIGIGFIVRDDRTGWTFIVNTFKHDPIKGDKAAIHAAKLALAVPPATTVYAKLKERLEPEIQREIDAAKKKERDIYISEGWPMRSPTASLSEGASKGHTIPQASPSPLPEPIPEPEPPPPPGTSTGGDGGLGETRPPPSLARQIIHAFDGARRKRWGENQGRAWDDPTDLVEAGRWIAEGATLAMCQEVFERKFDAWKGDDLPKMLRSVSREMNEAIVAARAPTETKLDHDAIATRRKRNTALLDAGYSEAEIAGMNVAAMTDADVAAKVAERAGESDETMALRPLQRDDTAAPTVPSATKPQRPEPSEPSLYERITGVRRATPHPTVNEPGLVSREAADDDPLDWTVDDLKSEAAE